MPIDRTIAASLQLAADCVQDAQILLDRGSRNAAYLCSQAAEHLVRAVASSERLHIERSHAHLIDTTIRRFPDENLDKAAFLRISNLEIYSTIDRYPSSTGRLSPSPSPDLHGTSWISSEFCSTPCSCISVWYADPTSRRRERNLDERFRHRNSHSVRHL